jgi:predicted peptidase
MDWGTFDNTSRLYAPWSVFWDTTSHTYNGLQDTGVKVQALSPSGSYVTAYLQSQAGPFNAHIVNPKNNYAYKNTTVIDFKENNNNNTGTVSCVWKKTGNVVISNSCAFSASPHSFGIDSTGCSPNTTPITLIATDSGSGLQVTDVVNIKVYVKFMCEKAGTQGRSAAPD